MALNQVASPVGRSPFGLSLLAVAVGALFLIGGTDTALADGYEPLPLPVNTGCFGIDTYGIPLFGGSGSVTINPPGSILAVYIHWVGVDDETPPSPAPPVATSTLTINGTAVTGTQNTVPGPGYSARFDWFSWWANIGPAAPPFNGLGLVDDLNLTVGVSDWDSTASFKATNGATVTVIYDTGPCPTPNRIEIQIGVDYYFHRFAGDERSELLVFSFPADPVDRVLAVHHGHGGSDATQTSCRGGAIWMLAGTGPAPQATDFDLVEEGMGGRGRGINGGVEIVNDPFTSALMPCVPGLNLLPDEPYEPGHPYPGGASTAPYRALGLSPADGGDVGEEWGVIEVVTVVPAGTEWVAFQLESEADENGESGSWAGASYVFGELPFCGDGVIQPGEACDDGSHCFDLTPCTQDFECRGIGDQRCLPRDTAVCPSDCKVQTCDTSVSVVCADRDVCNDGGECSAAVSCTPGVAIVCDSSGAPIAATCQPPGPYPVGQTDVQVTAGGLNETCPVTVRDCEPPTCIAPNGLLLECSSPCGVPDTDPSIQAMLAGFSADDNCAIDSTRLFAPPLFPSACGAGATTPVTYVATDSAGYQAFCASAVTVQDTTPPTITCPAPITLECTDENGVPVDDAEIRAWIATATASDTCGDVTITNDAPPFLPPGCGPGQETVVTFTATDDCGLQEVCTSTITVVDPPPVITSCGDAEECLWPANHKYVCIEGFSIDLGIEDACGDAFLVDVECTSSQCDDAPCSEFPDDKGDGHTTNDCFYDAATDTLCARAERAGNQKEGRYYSVTAIAGDDCGPTSPQLVLTIWVPHDKREAKGCRSPE